MIASHTQFIGENFTKPVAGDAETEEPAMPIQSDASSQSHEDSSEGSGSSSTPKWYRLISDVYANTEEIELKVELLLLGVEKPATYKHAVKEKPWEEAIKSEIDSIERNNTWKLMELPSGHKPIRLKWLYKLKMNTDGEIVKYKVRLVAKGYVQRQGVDFEEVYAPVTGMETV